MGTRKDRSSKYVAGNQTVAGTGTITGAATLSGAVSATDTLTVSGVLTGSTAVSAGKLQFGTVTALSTDQTVTAVPGLLVVSSGAALTLPTPVAGDVWFIANASTQSSVITRSTAGVTFNSPVKAGATTVTLADKDTCILVCQSATVYYMFAHSSGVTST